MTWQNPVFLSLLTIAIFATACTRYVPSAPSDLKLLTISGHVYEQETAETGEPMLAEVVITVQGADGARQIGATNTLGFYTLSVDAGRVSITASKSGYVTRGSSFNMSISTVLNFSLTPVIGHDVE